MLNPQKVEPDERIKAEIKSLIDTGARLLYTVQGLRTGMFGQDLAEVTTWVTRLGQLVRSLYGVKSQHFEAYSSALATQNFYNLHSSWNAHLSQMVGIAKAVEHDLANGLLADFKGLVQADLFANFLEMGEYLLEEGYKDAAAVIIGTVLENSLRKLAESKGIRVENEFGKSLSIEPLNSELAKHEVYSKLIQKQITSWAHIRNKAAHGEYSEYNKEQVSMMLLFVQQFAADYLR